MRTLLFLGLFLFAFSLTHQEKETLCKQHDHSTCACVLLGKSDQEILRCKNHRSQYCEEINKCWERRQTHLRCKKIEFSTPACRRFERSSIRRQMRVLERRKRRVKREIAKVKPFDTKIGDLLAESKKIHKLLHLLRQRFRSSNKREVLQDKTVKRSEEALQKLNSEYEEAKKELKNATPDIKPSINFKLSKIDVKRKALRRNIREYERYFRVKDHSKDNDQGVGYLHSWKKTLEKRLKRLTDRKSRLEKRKGKYNSYHYNKWMRSINNRIKIVKNDLDSLQNDL